MACRPPEPPCDRPVHYVADGPALAGFATNPGQSDQQLVAPKQRTWLDTESWYGEYMASGWLV